MPTAQNSHVALAEFLCSRASLPAPAFVALKMAKAAVVWSERARSRRKLIQLTDDHLADLGLTREQAYGEYSKPFWKR